MTEQKLKVMTNMKITKEKQDNSNYILQNYFAFFDNKLQVSTNFLMKMY